MRCKFNHASRTRREAAFSLVEIVMATAIAGVCIAGVIYGYLHASRRADWSACSLAAHAQALQQLERTRACKWDLAANPPVDELLATNFGTQTCVLDLPVVGTNIFRATNVTTITDVQTNPPLRMVTVNCIWTYLNGTNFTNTIITYRCPDSLGE